MIDFFSFEYNIHLFLFDYLTLYLLLIRTQVYLFFNYIVYINTSIKFYTLILIEAFEINLYSAIEKIIQMDKNLKCINLIFRL